MIRHERRRLGQLWSIHRPSMWWTRLREPIRPTEDRQTPPLQESRVCRKLQNGGGDTKLVSALLLLCKICLLRRFFWAVDFPLSQKFFFTCFKCSGTGTASAIDSEIKLLKVFSLSNYILAPPTSSSIWRFIHGSRATMATRKIKSQASPGVVQHRNPNQISHKLDH